MLIINGNAVASPSALNVSFEERGDFSKCNVLGERLADRLAVKRVIDVEWALLPEADMAAVLAAMGQKVFFKATYPDPETRAAREIVCRAAERSARMYRMDGGSPVWADVRMRWEEQ